MAIGVASVLNSFALLREHVEQTEGEYRALLDQLQNGHAPVGADAPRRGRPPKASKTILDAVAAAALEAPEVVPEPVKVNRFKAGGKGRWAKFKTAAARSAEMKRIMKPKKTRDVPQPDKSVTYAVAELAKQIGYKGTWGLSVWLRDHGIPQSYEKRPDANGRMAKAAVITQKSYMKMMKLREKLGMKALNRITEKGDEQVVRELERATAA